MAAVLAVLLLPACGGDGDDQRVVLDGRPRHPDDQGVVTAVSFERIELAGERTYEITRDLQSFSTQTMQALPILHRKGQFVHVGLDGKRAVWIAAVGSVLGDPPAVYYAGKLERVVDGELIFEDGTVLGLGKGVRPPVPSGFVQVDIDPDSGTARSVSQP